MEEVAAELPSDRESSVSRTQLWLAQLGKHRHHITTDPDELIYGTPAAKESQTSRPGSRSHEELWEEQIDKKAKQPVEITIEDDEDDSCNNNNQRSPVRIVKINSMISKPQLTAVGGQAVISQVLPVVQQLPSLQPQLAAVNVPTQHQAAPNGYATLTANESVLKTILLDRSLRKRPASPPRPAAASIQQLPAAVAIQNGFQASAALLNSCPLVPVPNKEQKLQQLQPNKHEETDILRRRLLGIKDLPAAAAPAAVLQAPAAAPRPRFAPPSATITSKDPQAAANSFQLSLNVKNTPPLSAEEDLALQKAAETLVSLSTAVLEKPVTAVPKHLSQAAVIATAPDDLSQGSSSSGTPPPPPSADFTKTSVLKHLLHRYNSDNRRDTGVKM